MSGAWGTPFYEGKAKILYRTDRDTVIHHFKDSATAFNAQKKAEFAGKGALNVAFSVYFFEQLKAAGIETHFIQKCDERAFESLSLKMIPVEVVVRNIIAGSLAKRLQMEEGQILKSPIVEFFYKDDAKGDPLVSEWILSSIFNISRETCAILASSALRVNQVIKGLAEKANLDLVDFKLEFGRDSQDRILLGDEISPDTCRFWDKNTREKLDKDRFRFDLGDLVEGYQKVWDRLQGVQS